MLIKLLGLSGNIEWKIYGESYLSDSSDSSKYNRFSLSLENMKAKFKSKLTEIEVLENKYKDDNIVFFKMDKDSSVNYVVYSPVNNRILDYLKF